MRTNFFVGLGAQKCASTWLYEILSDHPDTVLSTEKEIDFFSYRFGRGYQWYERRFPSVTTGKVWGEISPSYFIEAGVPERICAYAPDAKLLLSLRDPVERAISNHRHEVRLGNFDGTDLSFEAGLRNNPLYLEQSRYGTHLLRWLRHFPRENIFICFQEDIENSPHDVAVALYRFLGIRADHVSAALTNRANASHLYRMQALEQVRRASRGTLRALGLDGLWRFAQRSGLQNVYRKINRLPPDAQIPPVSDTTTQMLRAELAEEIEKVEQITGRQLPGWHRVEPPVKLRVAAGA